MIQRSTLQGLYGTAGTIFPDNTSRLITEADMRAFGEDIIDSSFNLIDDSLTGAAGTKSGATDETTLKDIGTIGIATGAHVVYRDTGAANVLRVYELVAGTNSESSPDIIRPDDYNASTNAKVWKLAVIGGSTAGVWKMSGSWNASTNVVPSSGDSTVKQGFTYENGNHTSTSLLGPDGNVVLPYATLRALVDNPGTDLTDQTKWKLTY